MDKQEPVACDLGPMHGMASTFKNADGVECCDFCGHPVTLANRPADDGLAGDRDALFDALFDAIAMMGHCMNLSATALIGGEVMKAQEVWQRGHDLLLGRSATALRAQSDADDGLVARLLNNIIEACEDANSPAEKIRPEILEYARQAALLVQSDAEVERD